MTIKRTHEIKQLRSRRAKLEIDIKNASEESKEKQRILADLRNKLASVERSIKDLESGEVVITEHAIIRYLERVMGMDLEQVKREMITDENSTLICGLGSGKYPIGNGLKAVVKGKTVVTISY